MKILIIDDDPLVRYTLTKILTNHGYDVVTAVDGTCGFASVQSENPAIVITDMIMPEQEGIETIIQIRRERPDVGIVAISGGGRYGNLDFLPMAQSLGANQVLAKPFEADELLNCVQHVAATLSGPQPSVFQSGADGAD